MPDDSSKIVAFPTPLPGAGRAGAPSRENGSITMRSDLVVEASKIIPEVPVLINLVSARVKQLNMGRTPLVQTDHRMGAADIALTEIIEGKIIVAQDSME